MLFELIFEENSIDCFSLSIVEKDFGVMVDEELRRLHHGSNLMNINRYKSRTRSLLSFVLSVLLTSIWRRFDQMM